MTSYSNNNQNNRSNLLNQRKSISMMNNEPNDSLRTNQINHADIHTLKVTRRNVNHQKTRKCHLIPPPSLSNMQLVNSPSTSVRRARSSNNSDDDFHQVTNKKQKKKKKKTTTDTNQVKTPPSCSSTTTTTTSSALSIDNSTSSSTTSPGDYPIINNKSIDISLQARRFAETRYAFPPFIVKFKQPVDEKHIIKHLEYHFSNKYNFVMDLAGHRLKNKCDLFLFVNNRESFIMLFDDLKWPSTIDSINFDKIRPSRLPPQFSIVLRNVPLDTDLNELLSNIKQDYPDVLNAFRILNKYKQSTSFVRLDINNINTIDALLSKKFIYFNNLRLAITEYLAPAKVLICNKCFQIGHFRSTCKSTVDYCSKCGNTVNDIMQHKETCSNKLCCVRCKGEHDANDIRCPDVKTYRAELTRSLLNPPTAPMNQQQNKPNKQNQRANYLYNDRDFPVLNVNHRFNDYMNNHLNNNDKRIEELFTKMNKLNDNINQLVELNNNFFSQCTRTQQVLMKHEHLLQLHQVDTSLQHDFVSQFLAPICQMVVDIIPNLVKQNPINDKTLSCPSLTEACEKLTNDLSIWTNRFIQNDNLKLKLNNDFNAVNQLPPASSINSDQPPSANQ